MALILVKEDKWNKYFEENCKFLIENLILVSSFQMKYAFPSLQTRKSPMILMKL